MKVTFDTNTMTFEVKNENEKVYSVLGTKYGDGENFVMLITEEDLDSIGYDANEWDRDIRSLEIGETATHSYWFYGKANIIVRLA
jgi:hypothetical protein